LDRSDRTSTASRPNSHLSKRYNSDSSTSRWSEPQRDPAAKHQVTARNRVLERDTAPDDVFGKDKAAMCSFRQMMQRRIMSPAVGRPLAGPRFAVGVLAPAARFGPAATWVELEIERAEPIQAEDTSGSPGSGMTSPPATAYVRSTSCLTSSTTSIR
jgi:hypothetical protein